MTRIYFSALLLVTLPVVCPAQKKPQIQKLANGRNFDLTFKQDCDADRPSASGGNSAAANCAVTAKAYQNAGMRADAKLYWGKACLGDGKNTAYYCTVATEYIAELPSPFDEPKGSDPDKQEAISLLLDPKGGCQNTNRIGDLRECLWHLRAISSKGTREHMAAVKPLCEQLGDNLSCAELRALGVPEKDWDTVEKEHEAVGKIIDAEMDNAVQEADRLMTEHLAHSTVSGAAPMSMAEAIRQGFQQGMANAQAIDQTMRAAQAKIYAAANSGVTSQSRATSTLSAPTTPQVAPNTAAPRSPNPVITGSGLPPTVATSQTPSQGVFPNESNSGCQVCQVAANGGPQQCHPVSCPPGIGNNGGGSGGSGGAGGTGSVGSTNTPSGTPSNSGNNTGGSGSSGDVQPGGQFNSCISTRYGGPYNWLQLVNGCTQSVSVTLYFRVNDVGGFSTQISPGGFSQMGWSQSEVGNHGGYELYTCLTGYTPVTPAGITIAHGGAQPQTYVCKR